MRIIHNQITKRLILQSVLINIIFFFFAASSTYALSLSDISTAISGTISYGGSESNLTIQRVSGVSGVYEIRANQFSCTPGSSGCDPDRYDIVFNRNIPYIYGLGMQAFANRVETADFLDVSFGNGHVVVPSNTNNQFGFAQDDFYQSDTGRMRRPIFVLPTESLIIVYDQPVVKKIKLQRLGGQTNIVLKKHDGYPEGSPGTLIIIKGSSISDTYSKYYQYLKNGPGYFFKKPQYRVFGLNWETYDEFGGVATDANIRQVVNSYESAQLYGSNAGLTLSTITIGSGYWGAVNYDGTTCPENCVGCGTPDNGCPASDALVYSSTRYKDGLTSLFDWLQTKNIYPIIGMRNTIETGGSYIDNYTRISEIFKNTYNINYPFLRNKTTFYRSREGNQIYFLDTKNTSVINAWLEITQNRYGSFKGIKDDDMVFTDQKRIDGTKANFFDDVTSYSYKRYVDLFGEDFIIWGRNEWLGFGLDALALQGSTVTSAYPQRTTNGYAFRHLPRFCSDEHHFRICPSIL